MLDDDIRRARECEVPWSELRQAAILRRIEKARVTPRRPSGNMRLVLAVVSALLAVSCFLVWRSRSAPVAARAVAGDLPQASGSPTSEAATVGSAVLRLADGSVARQADGAHVEIEAIDVGRTELLQTQGIVDYEIAPNPARRFVVRSRDVSVSVLGTIFRVDVEAQSVAVRVERGQVEVAQQERRVKLSAGEGITLETLDAPLERAASGGGSPAASPTIEASPRASAGPSATPRDVAKGDSPLALLDRADHARADRNLDDAAAALHELLQRYPNDTRVALAQFMLGRVESERGSNAEAARAFAACVARGPAGALAEDALAEWAAAQSRSGDPPGATATAKKYLATYPNGVHRRAMQRLVDDAR
jgi:TolA-binding protein